MSSIISEKEITKDQVTKLKMRQKTKQSLKHKPEQVHTKKRRKKMKLIPPKLQNKCLLYKLPTVRLNYNVK